MTNLFRYAEVQDSIQEGGHSTQWYLYQAALRNARGTRYEIEITDSVEGCKGRLEDAEAILVSSEQAKKQHDLSEWKRLLDES
jgi:hypothetical protein